MFKSNRIFAACHSIFAAHAMAAKGKASRRLHNAASAAPTWILFLRFLGPLMLCNALQALSGTANNIYLGQMIGVHALGAVSAFFPVQFFLISFVVGVSSGAAVVIAQAFGGGENDRAKAAFGTTLTTTIAAGLLIAIFGMPFARDILVGMGTPNDIVGDATAYAHIMLVALPGLLVFLVVTSMLIGIGDSVTPAIGLVIATAAGLVATPALIQGWAGLPRQGVASGAFATIFSSLATLALLGVYLRRRGHPLAPDAKLLASMRIDWGILGLVLRIGVPTGVQLVIVSLAEVAVVSFVNRFGSDATAAYGAVNQVASYVQFPTASIALVASIFTAQAIGAGHNDRLRSIVRTGIVFNLVLTGTLVGLAYLCSRPLLAFFIVKPAVIDLAHGLLQITLWSYVALGVAAVITGVMRASGTVLVPTLISIFAIVGIEVPAAWWLSDRIGVNGIWYAYPIAFMTTLAAQAAFFHFFWKHKAIVQLAKHPLVHRIDHI
jgi:putative MATE family efflux protein